MFRFEHIEWDSWLEGSENQAGGPRWKEDINITWAMMVKVGSRRRDKESRLQDRMTNASSSPVTTQPWLRDCFVPDTLQSAWHGLSHFIFMILQRQAPLLYRQWNWASQECPELTSSWLIPSRQFPLALHRCLLWPLSSLQETRRSWKLSCFWNHTQGTALTPGLPGIVFTYICTVCK